MVFEIANHLVFLIHFGFRFVSLHNSCSHFLILFFSKVLILFIYKFDVLSWCYKCFTIPCVLILEVTNHFNLVFLYTLFLYLLHCTTLILNLSLFSWNIFIFSFLCDELMLQIFTSCFLCVAQLPFWIFM